MLRTLDDKAWDELERMHRSGDVYTVASAAECVRGHPLFGTTYGTEGLLVLVNAPEHTGLLLMFAHAWAGAAQYKLRTLGPFPLGRGVVAALVPIDQLVPRDDLRYSPNPLRELRGRPDQHCGCRSQSPHGRVSSLSGWLTALWKQSERRDSSGTADSFSSQCRCAAGRRSSDDADQRHDPRLPG